MPWCGDLPDGRTVIGTQPPLVWDGKAFSRLLPADQCPAGWVVAADGDGRIYFLTAEGLGAGNGARTVKAATGPARAGSVGSEHPAPLLAWHPWQRYHHPLQQEGLAMNRRDLLRIGVVGAAAWAAGRTATAWAAGTPGAASAPASAPATQPAGRRFAIGDMAGKRVLIVAADGTIEWEHPAPNVGDLWVLPGGNVLFTTGRGAMEVTREKKVVWKYETASEVYTCQRLANGNTFVGECSAARLLEVTPEGKIAREIKLLAEPKGGHMFMRNARVLADGHCLVAHTGGGTIREYDADGKKVWEAAAPSPYAAIRLPSGSTLVSCGEAKGGSKVMEIGQTGKTVWEVAQKDVPDILLAFMTGMHRLPNGNTVMSNWLGHGKLGKAPHLIEVTPDKKVVWTYANHRDVKTVATVQCLDVKGDAVKGELIR
jgi:hypothetical protein